MDDKTKRIQRYFAKMNRMPTMWQAGVYPPSRTTSTPSRTPEPAATQGWAGRAKPIGFSRNGKLREDNLMVHDLMLVESRNRKSKYPGTITRSSQIGEEASAADPGVRW
jgi:branched-chain amino acid transport system substrate-binding protein